MFIQITYRNSQLINYGSRKAIFLSFQRKLGPWVAWNWDSVKLHVACLHGAMVMTTSKTLNREFLPRLAASLLSKNFARQAWWYTP